MSAPHSERYPTLSEAHELRVKAICARFGERLLAGGKPPLEAYLDENDDVPCLPLLQELLRLEIEWRLQQYETFSTDDYLARFPQIERAWLAAIINPCPSSEQLSRYLAQELTGSTRDSLAHHINTCTECWSTLKGLENRAEPAAPERLPEPPPPNYAPRDIIVEHVAPEPPSKPSTALPPDGEPSTIAGRYQIIKVLGEGGFGRVYLAHDEQLDRRVAVKVPHPNRIAQPDDFEQFLAEARLLASFDHPHIVPVHDTGRTEAGLCYVVSKFIAGTDLAEKITQSSRSFTEAAELVATVAEALHYAHHKGVVHRDVKPGNILLDTTGRPFVVDFGLALKDQDFGKGAGFAGTPNYMSPEQARGEGHRVDGRSDIFSLGVVFYELLTGRRPFRGETVMALLQHIASGEPRPPRQVDDSIPSELERICLKALAKRVSERYTTAQDLAVDLRHFLEHAPASIKSGVRPSRSSEARPAPPSTPKVSTTPELHPLRIIPKGLRSFDAHDADFFLELLPGPRDRAGLPDTIRFWKTRIEESDPDHSFAVGMIYGPSGCGKSSLVKAGLVPRLSDEVIVIYVEATAAETETRLLNGLRKRCPTLSTDLDLKETLADLRRQQGIPQGKKLLLVLDQFEQWLHVQKDPENTELVQALRQCDSGRVQCIVMVRDDFWMAVTRFMHALEIRLVEGRNSAVVDLFDLAHARKVLAALGRAFGKIPQTSEGTTKERKDFLTQAVSGLAQEGKVICVRLALFAEMMKGKSWTPATLKKMGGAQGVGLTFLEETFSAATAPPEHRYHQKAARAVLKALLPESGANIKGHMRTQADLLAASGYASRPKDFDELIHILDIDTRLITPTDPEGKDEGERTKGEPECPTDSSLRYYQLTHDYLVHSLRDWLTHKQRETKRGRAELLLADRAAFWTARPEIRELPSLAQWVRIHWRTQRSSWTRLERKMMRVANRYHLVRGLIAATVVVLLALIGWEGFGRLKAQTYRDRLLVASTADVPPIVADLAPYRRWADPLLKEAYAQADENHDSRRQLHLSLSLLPVDPGQTAYLYERLLKAEPEELIAIREALHSQRAGQLDRLWAVAENHDVDWEARFRAACALATFDPDNPRWQNINRDVAKRLTRNPLVVAKWTEVLRPVAECLLPPLASFLEDETRSGSERGLIALVYGNYAANQPDAIAKLEQVLTIESKSNATVETKIALAKRQANIGAALMILGRTEKVWPLLKYSSDPTRRSFLIDRFASCNVDAQVLASRLQIETDASIRQALLLCLTEFGLDRLPEGEQKELPPRLVELYRNDADPGIRAAAEALLRKWNADEKLTEIDKAPADRKMVPGRRWYVDGQGHTMIVVPTPGETWVGEKDERHQRTINRSYAIASKEVTVDQFLRFRAKHISATKFSSTRDGPVGCVTWFDAVAYCNWLSEQEGIPSDQWCYLPNQNGEFANGMKMAPDYLGRTGYRLPTEAEWEHACRAGSITEWSHGDAEELIGKYAWCNANSFERSRPVGKLKPNRLGLFDMHGNAWEWCQDRYVEIPIGNRSDDSGDLDGIHEDEVRVPRGGAYIFRPATSRSAFRHKFFPTERQDYVGFRPAKTIAGK